MDDETLVIGGLLLAFLLTAKDTPARQRSDRRRVSTDLSSVLELAAEAEMGLNEARQNALAAGQDVQAVGQWRGLADDAQASLEAAMEDLNKIMSSLTGEVDAQGNPMSTFSWQHPTSVSVPGVGASVNATQQILGYVAQFTTDLHDLRRQAAVLEADIYEAAANLVEDRFRLVDLVVNSEKGVDLSKEASLAQFLDIDQLHLKVGVKPALAEMMNFLNGADNTSRYDWIKESTSITDPHIISLVKNPEDVMHLFRRDKYVSPVTTESIKDIGYTGALTVRDFNRDSADPSMFSQIALVLIRDPKYGTREKDESTPPLFKACTVPFTGGVTFSLALNGGNLRGFDDAISGSRELSSLIDLGDATDSRSYEELRDYLEATDRVAPEDVIKELRLASEFIKPFREGMNDQAAWVSRIHDTWRIIASFLWDERNGHDTIDQSGVTSSAVESRTTVLNLAHHRIVEKIDNLAATQRLIEARLNGVVPLLLALVDHLDKVRELDVKDALEGLVGPHFVASALGRITNAQAVAAYNFVSEEESENLGAFGNLRALFGGVVTAILNEWDQGVRSDLQKMTARINSIQEGVVESYFRFAKIVDAAQAAVIFTGPTDIQVATEQDVIDFYPDPMGGYARVARKFGFNEDGEHPDARIYGGELQSEPNTPPIIYNNTGARSLRGTKRKYIIDEIHQITEAQNANWQNPGYEISDFVLSGEPQNEGMLRWWGLPLAQRFDDAANDQELSSKVPLRHRYGCNWLARQLNYMEGDQRLTNLHGPVIRNFLARTAKLQRVWAGLSSRFHTAYVTLRHTLLSIDGDHYVVLDDPVSVEGFNDLHSLEAARLAAEEGAEREQIAQSELHGFGEMSGGRGLVFRDKGNPMPKRIDLGRRVCPCNVENYYYPDEEEDPMNLTEAMAVATSPMIDFGAEPMAAIPALTSKLPQMPAWIEPPDQMADVSWQKGGKNWAAVNQGYPERRFIENPYWLDLNGGAIWNLAKSSPIPPPQKVDLGDLSGGGALGGGDIIQIAGMFAGMGSGSLGDLGSNYNSAYLLPPSGGGAAQRRARIARNWSQGIPASMDELLPIVEDGIDLDKVPDRPRWPGVVLTSLSTAFSVPFLTSLPFPGLTSITKINAAAYMLQASRTPEHRTSGFNIQSYQRLLALAMAFQSKISLPAKIYLAFLPKTNRQDSGYGNPEVNYYKWVGYPNDYLRGEHVACRTRNSGNPDAIDKRYCLDPVNFKVPSWFREYVVSAGQPHHTALLKYIMQYEYEAMLDLMGEEHADGSSNPWFRIMDINGWSSFYSRFEGVKTDVDGHSFFKFFKVDEDTLRSMYDLTAAEASFLAVRATDLADTIAEEGDKAKQRGGGHVPLIGQTPSGAAVSGVQAESPPQDDFDGETTLLLGVAAAAAVAIAAGHFAFDPEATGQTGGGGGGAAGPGLGDEEGDEDGGGTIWDRARANGPPQGPIDYGPPLEQQVKAWCEANDPTGTYPECKPFKKASSGGSGSVVVPLLVVLGLYAATQS